MIKNIVFDMGNVLIMFYPERTLSKYLDSKDDIRLVLDKFFASEDYRECDRGTKTYSEIIDGLKGQLPEHLINLLRQLFVENCFGKKEMPPFEGMYELIENLKAKGYKTYLLSNAGTDFYDYALNVPAVAALDGRVVSSDYHLLKPEKEIYKVLFEKFDLKPSECIFIDDSMANIEGAAFCGMDGICFSPAFEDVGVLIEKLKNKGINI